MTRQTDPGASVVIPVSEAHYGLLDGQLRRLACQTGAPDFEIVVADNDGRLCSDMIGGDERISVVDASGVRGPAAARNVGVEAARGDLLLFCDADDLVSLNWVEEQCRALRQVPLAAGALWLVDSASIAQLAAEDRWPTTSFTTGLWRHEGLSFAVTANCGVRRSDLERVGGFPENYRWSEDVAFSFALRRVGVTPTFVPAAMVVKLRPELTRREVQAQQVGLGAAQVALRRDYGYGPSLPMLGTRAVGRAFTRAMRHAVTRRAASRDAALAYRWRACGTLGELRQPRPSTRT